SGPAGALGGRKPTTGKGTWSVVSGDWFTEPGVARVRAADGGLVKEPAEVLIDCGATDVEITATFAFPKEAKGDNWLPGFTSRAEGPKPTGRINPRIAWNKGSPDLEVWDLPTDTAENRSRWKDTDAGPNQGKLVPVQVGGSNQNGSIK